MQPPARERGGSPATTRGWERQARPAGTLTFNFWLPGCEGVRLHPGKPPVSGGVFRPRLSASHLVCVVLCGGLGEGGRGEGALNWTCL